MAIKLEVKNLYKIFGDNPDRAFKYIEKGATKDVILEKTGLSLGVKNASLAIKKARYSSSWGYPVQENQPWFAFSIV